MRPRRPGEIREIGKHLYDTEGMPSKRMIPKMWKKGIRHLVISSLDINKLHAEHGDFIADWMERGGTHEIADIGLEAGIFRGRKRKPGLVKAPLIEPEIRSRTEKGRGVLLVRLDYNNI